MASPPTAYPNTTLNAFNPTTGERQLRRTPVGLRRMYETPTPTDSAVSNQTQTESGAYPFCWPLLCLLLLLLLLIGGVLGLLGGLGVFTPSNVVPIANASSTASPTESTGGSISTGNTPHGNNTISISRTTMATTGTGGNKTSISPSSSPATNASTKPQSSTSPSTGSTTTPTLLCDPAGITGDIYLLLDNSIRSMSTLQFNDLKSFVHDFFSQFTLGLPISFATRITLIVYAEYGNVQISFISCCEDKAQYLIQIDGLVMANQEVAPFNNNPDRSNLGNAIQTAMTYSDNRTHIPYITMIFTGTSPTDEQNAIVQANKMKNNGVTVMTIAIGSTHIDVDGIASKPQLAFKENNFSNLNNLNNVLINALCQIQSSRR